MSIQENLKFMWGFEIGAGVGYYKNSGWGVPDHTPTGSFYALYDTQFYEAHQPPTNVGGGLRSLKQTSFYEDPDAIDNPAANLLAFAGTYCEITTPPMTGSVLTPGDYHWQDGFAHFSFKHDFDFDFDQTTHGVATPAALGSWIHLCTLASGSANAKGTGAIIPFFDGSVIADGTGADVWMPLPTSSLVVPVTADPTFVDQGYRPDGYISFYLVRQLVDKFPDNGSDGGPASAPGDYVVAIVYYDSTPSAPPNNILISSAPVTIDANTWSQFAIRYNCDDVNGDVQVWQDGALIMDEQDIKTRDGDQPSEWNCITFSPHGKYSTAVNAPDGFPKNIWPEYSHLVDHLFLWDSNRNASGVQAYATSSLFIQGLKPNNDFSIENFRNSDGGATNLFDYVDDPGDPTPLEVSWCTASSVPPTSCSFDNVGVGNVTNGAISWSTYLPGGSSADAFGEFIGVNAIVACSQTGSTNYKGTSFMVDTVASPDLDFFGSSSIISRDQLLWSMSPTDIHNQGTEWDVFEIQELKMGFKIEPE